MVKVVKTVANHRSGVWPISRASSLCPCSSICNLTIRIMPLVLGAMACLPFYITQNHGWTEAKPIADKQETLDFAAVNWCPEQKQADIAKELWLSPSTVSTVVGRKKAVKAKVLIFNGKTKKPLRQRVGTCALSVFVVQATA